MDKNNIKFAISIDYEDEQTEQVMMMCKTMKRMLQFGKYEGRFTDYDILDLDSQDV